MASISTYPILSNPTINDILIGTDVQDLNITKNFSIGSIIGIVGTQFVPYTGAIGNVNLGAFNITATSFIVAGGTASQFLKANGTLDSTAYVPTTRTLTINSISFDLSANRSWDLNTIDTLTTTGTSGAATYVGKTLNIPQYQGQGNYITQLSGEATAFGPGNATVTLSNLAVISKILTGLNITGGTVVDTDSILIAFGKVQNQINGLMGGVTYQGTWNAATNTPFLQSSVGTKGYYYVVSVPGNTNLNGITNWQLGDWAIYNGTAWEKVDNTDAVVSVNGYTGAVVLTFSDVGAPPATRNLTINGVQFDLSADRTWTVGDVRTDQTYANPTWITSLAWTKITGTPTTLAGYGITDGALNTTELTINGVTFNLSANRTWNVGTVTSVGTSGPLTGGTITGSGTIGITQSGVSSDGYLSSTDWNTFNNKQNALTNPVTGTGTINTLPMWGGATSLVNSPLSYGPDNFNFQYNSATGGTVTFTNSGLTTYAYVIQMNNFGSPRSTFHSYTDGIVVQSIAGVQVSRVFANGNTIIGDGTVDNGRKLEIEGNLYIETIINATTDTDRFIVSDSGVIKYRTGAELLSDIAAQGAITLTTTGTSGASTLVGNTLNIPNYSTDLSGYVPYTGATANVNLGIYSLTASALIKNGGTSGQFLKADGSVDSSAYIVLGSLSASAPLSYNNLTGAFSIIQSGTVTDGYLSSTDWNTFNNKQGALTLTTTGTSGASTLIGNTLNIPAYTDQFVGTVTSVGLSMPSAFTVSNSPVTSSGTLTVVGAGLASQYVRGDGSLGDFPGGGGGGGSSVSYYLNGSVNQGTFVGNTYYEMSKVPIFGAGTDFNIATNGYVAQFITDVNDPESLLIPAGNWNFETYFSASSAGGTPSFYIELYKYDGTTFTLIASSVATPELISFGTNIEPYFSSVAVPETVLTITDRLAIRVYVNNSGRTITLHTEDSHLCQVVTTFTTGLTALNGLTTQVQYFSTGTTGADFNISSAVATHTFNLPTASAANRGALSSADWTTFNNKQPAGNYVTTDTTQTITALKTILRGGDVLNFKIGVDTLYGLKIAYNQNELVPSGEATWSFVNTFNNGIGTGLETTPISFFRGVLVTGERLLSVSVNSNLLSYYGNNPSGRYPIYAYNTGVQQFQDSILVGFNTGVVNAVTGAIASLPAGVVANFNGRVIGSNAVNSNEFVTLSQISGFGTGTVTSVSFTLGATGTNLSASVATSTTTPAITLNVPTASASARGALSSTDWSTFNGKQDAITLTTTGTSGAATLVGATLNIPQYQASGTYVTSVTGTSPIVSSGGTTPAISIPVATTSVNGYLSSTDWTTFNNKQGTITLTTTGTSGAATFSSNTLNIPQYQSVITNPVTGTGSAGQVAYWSSGSAITGESNLFWDATNDRLGISHSSPGAKLDIVSTGTGSEGLRVDGAGGGFAFVVKGGTEYSTHIRAGATIGESYFTTPPVNGLIVQGNVGIGTTNPVVALDLGGATGKSIHLYSSAGDFYGINMLSYDSGPFSTNIFAGDGGQIKFRTASGTTTQSTRMTISALGNVGIGVTPSAWYSSEGYKALQVGNASLFGRNSTNSELYLSSNTFENSSGNPTYITSDFATRYAQNDGVHSWLTAISGTAGNAISFTQAMTLTSSGNLLVGTTTDAGFKLDVNGTGRFSGALTVTGAAGGQLIRSQTTIAAGRNYIQFANPSGDMGYIGYGAADNKFYVSNQLNDDMLFATNNVTRLTIASTGAATFSSSVTVATDVTLNNGILYVSAGSGTSYAGRLSTAYIYPYITTYLDSFAGAGWEGRLQFRTNSAGGAMNTQLTILNNGNVLIGTTTDAGYKLDVNGTGRFSGVLTTNSGTNSTNGIQIISSLSSSLFTGGIEFIRTTVAGGSKIEPLRDAAIGGVGLKFLVTANNTAEVNATYTNALQILNTGAATFSAATSAITLTANGAANQFTARLLASSTTSQSYGLTVQAGTNSTDIGFQVIPVSGSGSLLYVRGDGNVGIGTTSPVEKLEVVRTTGAGCYIKLQDTVGSNYVGTESGNLVFLAPLTERMRITSGGNVGIGTTSPGQRLVVENSTDTFLQLRNSAAGQNFFIGALNGEARLNNDNSTPITMWVNGSERMRITSGGNVGIGTSSPTNKLTISNDGNSVVAFRINDTNANASFLSFNASNTDSAIIAGGTSAIPFDIYTGGSIRMRITSGGNVLIGTTTDAGKKLRVNGQTFTNELITLAPEAESISGAEWRFGTASIASITPNRRLRVKVGGVEYYIGAVEV